MKVNLYEEVDDLYAAENRESSEEAKGASNERELGNKVCFCRASHFVKRSRIEVDVHHLWKDRLQREEKKLPPAGVPPSEMCPSPCSLCTWFFLLHQIRSLDQPTCMTPSVSSPSFLGAHLRILSLLSTTAASSHRYLPSFCLLGASCSLLLSFQQ